MESLDRAKIERLLTELCKFISQLGIEGSIQIVGGAAMSLNYNSERYATGDIDAIFPEDPRINEFIKNISTRENISEKWINSQFLQYLPFDTSDSWVKVLEVNQINVWVANPRLLLAMKLKADRGIRDRQDIELLLQICEVSSYEDVEDIFEIHNDQSVMKPRTQTFVREWIELNS